MEPNIERDIVAMTRVDKPALLKRLFELGAAYSGQILSYTKMLGQLQDSGNTTTLARYLDLLAQTGLLVGLPEFSNETRRRRASSPKLNVLNTALMTADSGILSRRRRRTARSGAASSKARSARTCTTRPRPTSASPTGGTGSRGRWISCCSGGLRSLRSK